MTDWQDLVCGFLLNLLVTFVSLSEPASWSCFENGDSSCKAFKGEGLCPLSSVSYNSKLWIELNWKVGQFNSNSYNVRFEPIQFVVAANCNLNWIGGGMWPYLKNTLRFVVSWPYTKKSFCISVNLNFCQSFSLVHLFHLSIASTYQSLCLLLWPILSYLRI